jgi:hypothetical protein
MRTIHSIDRSPFCRTASLAAGVVILSLFPMVACADDVVRVPWEGLSMAVGKTVLLATPRGPVITGRVTALEPEALVVQVTKTSDPNTQVKGEMRVPRATLRVVRMQTKGVLYRAAGASLGAAAGFLSGTGVAVAIDWHGNHDTGARALIAGGGAAGALIGYLAGNKADRRWTTIEIVP